MSHPSISGDGAARWPDGLSVDRSTAGLDPQIGDRPVDDDRAQRRRRSPVHDTSDPADESPSALPGPPDRDTRVTADDRAALMTRQKERFGGIKVGSAFFGWLTATGMSVLLIALLAAGGVAFGVATNNTVNVDRAVQESQQATGTAQTVGLVGAITLLVVLLAAYYCGGYVAGRMARFNGARQGLAVWVWGVLMALLIAAVAAIAGAQYDVFAQLNLPRLPVNEGQVTAVGAIAIGAAILAALIGAVLGGLAGMRFHRKVDQLENPSRTDHDAGHRS